VTLWKRHYCSYWKRKGLIVWRNAIIFYTLEHEVNPVYTDISLYCMSLSYHFWSCIFSNSSMFQFLTVNMMFYCTFQPRSKASQVKFLCKGFNSWTFLCLCKVDSVFNLCNVCHGWRSVDGWEGLRHSNFVPGNPSIHDTFHPFCHPVWFRDNGYY
jgi:hypothetical protein